MAYKRKKRRNNLHLNLKKISIILALLIIIAFLVFAFSALKKSIKKHSKEVDITANIETSSEENNTKISNGKTKKQNETKKEVQQKKEDITINMAI